MSIRRAHVDVVLVLHARDMAVGRVDDTFVLNWVVVCCMIQWNCPVTFWLPFHTSINLLSIFSGKTAPNKGALLFTPRGHVLVSGLRAREFIYINVHPKSC